MEIIGTKFRDVFVLNYKSFEDNRGQFVKTIHDDKFRENNLEYMFVESFYSVSKKDVIRGMHFQVPPYDHAKLVYVIRGRILDVVVDLRTNSPTYGQYLTIEISKDNLRAIYIGSGFAHGFLSLEEDSIVEYHTTTSQNKIAESGILFNSFGFSWPVEQAIVSNRDNSFGSFKDFLSPFK